VDGASRFTTNLFATMKTHLLIAIFTLVSIVSTLAVPPPFKKACEDLQRAHSIVTALQQGGQGGIGRNKATLPNLVTALSDAELNLKVGKNNNGSKKNNALKFIGSAKATLAAAEGPQRDQLAKVQLSIQGALDRLSR